MNPKIDLNHFIMATTRIGNWLTKSSHWNPVFTIRYSVRYGLKFRYNWSESVDAPARTTFVLPLTPTEPAHNRRPRISPASLLRNGETNFGLYHPRPSVRNPRDKDRPFNSCRLWQCVFHCRPQIDARQEDEDDTNCVCIYLPNITLHLHEFRSLLVNFRFASLSFPATTSAVFSFSIPPS